MIPFHQFQRYKMIEIIFELLELKKSNISILEVGANEHKNLEKFVSNKNIKYLDLLIPTELLMDPAFIQGDATNLSFEDGQFDFVVGLDVLEHIPPEKRKNFISEIERVSKYGFIISAPFKDKGIEEVEQRIGALFHLLYDDEILWSKEHQENGLPIFQDVENIINNFNGDWYSFNHASSLLFEKFMEMEFKSGLNPDIYTYWKSVNKYYNEDLFFKDFNNKESIRTFIMYGKYGWEEKVRSLPSLLKEISCELTAEDFNIISHHENTINYMTLHKNEDKNVDSLDYCQVYWDDGSGFSELNSQIFKVANSEKLFQLNFEIPSSSNRVRIDPCAKKCVVELLDIELINSGGSSIPEYKVSSNAFISTAKEYLFFENDPQIIVESPSGDHIKRMSCVLKYNTPNLGVSNRLVNEFQEQQKDILSKVKYNRILNKLKLRNRTLRMENEFLKTSNKTIEKTYAEEIYNKDEIIINCNMLNREVIDKYSKLEHEIEAIKNRRTYKMLSTLKSFLKRIREINK